MTIWVFNPAKEQQKLREEYRRKLQELRKREKAALSQLYAAYYLADEAERTEIEMQILKILDAERNDCKWP